MRTPPNHDGKNLAIERGHQNGVFPDLAAVVDLGKAKPQLARIIAFSKRRRSLKAPPRDHDATVPCSSINGCADRSPSASPVLRRMPLCICAETISGRKYHRMQVARITVTAQEPRLRI
jgi:hypothetical protein